jgi:LysR family nitrogen assimilation transcriptional regulator
MDIREMRYFTQVARAGSFSRAAALLNVTQSALSRQLKKLEDELGVLLLVRRSDGVEVTKAGSLLLGQAEDLIGHLGKIVDLVREREETFTGHLVLGLPPTAGLLIAPEIFANFRTRWPYATLHIREGISSSLEEWLLERRLDIAVLHNPSPLDGIDIVTILNERMVLACAPAATHQVEIRDGVRFRDLGDVPLILPSLPHSNRRLIERAAIQYGTRLNVALEVDSVPLTKVMVKRGFGSTILTFAGVAIEIERGELTAIPIDRPPLISNICIGMPREAKSAWLAMEMARMLRNVIATLVAGGAWAGAHLIESEHRP